MTYSKGTWNYDAESGIVTTDDRTGDWTKNPIGQTVICSVEPLDGVSNGDLIAAAPDLLDMMKTLLRMHISHHNEPAHVGARRLINRVEGLE